VPLGGGRAGAPVIVQHPCFPRLDGARSVPSLALFVAVLWAVIFVERPALLPGFVPVALAGAIAEGAAQEDSPRF